jgi:ECF sigma factor
LQPNLPHALALIRILTRAHFFGVAAKAMWHVLVDHARHRQTAKRGGELRVVALDDNLAISGGIGAEIVALDEALTALAKLDPGKPRWWSCAISEASAWKRPPGR